MSDISCVCFMGGDSNHSDLISAAQIVHKLGYKVAVYSGDDEIDYELLKYVDYYKVGR